MSESIDNLYHVKSIMVDYSTDPTGATQKVEIAGTYTDLVEAKAAAKKALFDLGYKEDFFKEYLVKEGSQNWSFGDGVLVHARSSAGDEFTVQIEATPNTLNIQPKPGTSKILDKLFYVIQTTIYFDLDRSGAKRDIIIEGAYLSRDDANVAARKALLEPDLTKDVYLKYEEFNGQADWPYGSAVMVHATAHNGTSFLVGVIPPE